MSWEIETLSSLDRPAFEALCNGGLYNYEYDSDLDRVRKDVGNKLRGEKNVSLIDFQEMLCFIEQSSGKGGEGQNDIIIRWNTWRLLCSKQPQEITEDWMRDYLVKNDNMASKPWDFFRKVAGC